MTWRVRVACDNDKKQRTTANVQHPSEKKQQPRNNVQRRTSNGDPVSRRCTIGRSQQQYGHRCEPVRQAGALNPLPAGSRRDRRRVAENIDSVTGKLNIRFTTNRRGMAVVYHLQSHARRAGACGCFLSGRRDTVVARRTSPFPVQHSSVRRCRCCCRSIENRKSKIPYVCMNKTTRHEKFCPHASASFSGSKFIFL